jgi:peptidoglycan endopeptidase LytF
MALSCRYNTSVDAITSANHLKSTVISIGQTLNIPNGKSDSGSSKPSSKNSGTNLQLLSGAD